jgi:lipopolysaccharide biosynthesis glycosyltransferase
MWLHEGKEGCFMSRADKKTICTIIAKNYVSFARTLCDSFLEQHPDGVCYVLIIDEATGYIDGGKEKFEIVNLDALNIRNQREFCYKYNVTELSTAVKPYLLKYLIDKKSIDKILYLDPDILITNPLSMLFDELDKHDIILTPHLDTDYPDDGLKPNDSNIMVSGIFNLGFIGVRKSDNVNQFLLWWQIKLYDKCVTDFAAGYFVDQKFIEYAIVLFKDFSIIYDIGFNVAYWNLHSRLIRSMDDQWRCNDGKLYFYHFSNYKPERPETISAHLTRYNFADMPDLKKLFLHYQERLIHNGYHESRTWPYTYNQFNTRKEFALIIKRMIRGYIVYINIRSLFHFRDYPFYFNKAGQIISTIYRGTITWLLRRFKRSRRSG